MAVHASPPNDFARALQALREKYGLPSDMVLRAVEEALAVAYRRECEPTFPVVVKVDPETGQQRLYAVKRVVSRVRDEEHDVSLVHARKLYSEAREGDSVDVELPLPESWGRIAAHAFKQIVQQKIRDAEHAHTYQRYVDQEGELVSGVVTRLDAGNVYVGLGGTEGVLPPAEQVPTERYAQGQHLRAFLLDVQRTLKGTQIILSRTHRGLLRRILELEVPEIHAGTVEIKAIAREPGSRSKVAVHTRQDGLDPIGACIGVRRVRIQNIVNELNGEKVDIVLWHPEPGAFVASALSPAPVLGTEVLEADKKVVVTVPSPQLSLAIGKEGQNARLAARLTGWRIDIHAAEASTPTEGPDGALLVGAAAGAPEKG